MHHVTVESLAWRDGVLHDRDPRVKIALVALFVVQVVGEDDPTRLLAHLALALAGVAIARLPPLWLAGRLALLLPFALAVAVLVPFSWPGEVVFGAEIGGIGWTLTREGLRQAGLMAARAVIASLAALLLACTTRFGDLLRGLRGLGLPRILLLSLGFLYRYLFVLAEEARRMRIAAIARGMRARRLPAGALGGLLGSLFLRTYERAERVHRSMVARGFSGEVPMGARRAPGGADLALLAGGAALIVLVGL